MKTLSVWVWMFGAAVSSMALLNGCKEDRAAAEIPVFSDNLPAYTAPLVLPEAAPPVAVVTQPPPAAPPMPLEPAAVQTPAPVPPPPPAPAPSPSLNSQLSTLNSPVLPKDLNVSTNLAAVIKMLESGLSEDVILSYITNSPQAYNLTPDTVIYLNDLGVSSAVITALLQQDGLPENAASKGAVQPLPPGVALTAPAPNIYPPAISPPQYDAAPVAPAAVQEVAPAQEVAYPPNPAPQSPEVSYFYESLAPYGSWVNIEPYGLVWQPTVAVVNAGWRPYGDAGRWLWSDAGWYWYSDYSWGWAPFHYGRWQTHSRWGWVWVPDTCWGPSWVTWRHTPFYCGWAPLPPGCAYRPGFGLWYHSHSVGLEFDFGFAPGFYTWVHLNRFADPFPHRYYVPRHRINEFVGRSAVVNNIYVGGGGRVIINEGPGLQRIARATRSDIPHVAIADEARGVRRASRLERLEDRGGRLTVVRPAAPPIETAAAPGAKSDPSARNLAPAASRSARTQPALSPKQETRNTVTPATAPNSLASKPALPSRSDDNVPRARPVLPSRLAPAEKPAVSVTNPKAVPTVQGPAPAPAAPVGRTAAAGAPTTPSGQSSIISKSPAPPARLPNNRAGSVPAMVSPPGNPSTPKAGSQAVVAPASQAPLLREPSVLNRGSRPEPPAVRSTPVAPRTQPSLTPAPAPTPSVTPNRGSTPGPTLPSRTIPQRPAAAIQPSAAAPIIQPPFQSRTGSAPVPMNNVRVGGPVGQPTYSAPAAPAFRAPKVSPGGSSPSFAPRAIPNAPAFRAPSVSPGGSSPSFAPRAAPSAPAPVFRSSEPAMRSAPAPAMRSEPARMSPPPSAPAPSRSSPATPSSSPPARNDRPAGK